MSEKPLDRNSYLKETSARFQQVHGNLDKIIVEAFPSAELVFEYNMPSCRVRITKEPITVWKGTIDPNYLFIAIVERKSGITLHLWDPRDYYGLEAVKDELTKVGFKVMRGCIHWNRKADYPIETVEKLIRGMEVEKNPS
ncbi:MAG: hypothetical protein HW403_1447 [Dehalococcoidia bacterium]|nr:hypothetical protein [Dehalococcoidia bacterium]